MIAGFTNGHTGTNCLDDASPFVAECHGHISGQVACNHVIIGVADTGGGYFYLYLVLLGWVKFDFFNADRFAWRIQNCSLCLH